MKAVFQETPMACPDPQTAYLNKDQRPPSNLKSTCWKNDSRSLLSPSHTDLCTEGTQSWTGNLWGEMWTSGKMALLFHSLWIFSSCACTSWSKIFQMITPNAKYPPPTNIYLIKQMLKETDILEQWLFLQSPQPSRYTPAGAPGWLNQLSAWLLILAQVMISRFVGLSLTSGSMLSAQSLVGILSPPLLCSSHAHGLSQKKKNE